MADAKTKGIDQIRERYARVTPGIHAASAAELDDQAEELMAAQRARVRVKSGKTRDSIRKIKGDDDLHIFVVAGGETTTKEARKGSGAPYDYAVGEEFGNEHAPANPFFYGPYRAKRKAFVRRRVHRAQQAVKDITR